MVSKISKMISKVYFNKLQWRRYKRLRKAYKKDKDYNTWSIIEKSIMAQPYETDDYTQLVAKVSYKYIMGGIDNGNTSSNNWQKR